MAEHWLEVILPASTANPHKRKKHRMRTSLRRPTGNVAKAGGSRALIFSDLDVALPVLSTGSRRDSSDLKQIVPAAWLQVARKPHPRC